MYSEEAQRTIRIIENEYKIDWNDKEALEKLTRLDLSRKQITDITPLRELKNLVRLDLSGNRITDISPLSEFGNLEVLYLRVNQISDITLLFELTKLTELDLGVNQIRDISSLAELTNLTELNLKNNQITDVTSLKELKNLTGLGLCMNKISDITPLKELKNLTVLSLEYNQISDIKVLKELKNLTDLYVSGNKIKLFPEELLDLNIKIKYDSLSSSIHLYSNPIEEPPLEILSQGNQAIREYFERIKKEGKLELNEVKVTFMGAEGVGKTSLLKRVLDNKFDKNENMTHGINIRREKISINDTEIKVNFWDFGGQEMMHSTHQFFLSHRSLYVVVLDGRKEENVEYWLNFIKSFGGNSPIIIVLNKMDDNSGFELNRKFLKEKYPNILDFFKTSCLDTEGISDFYDYLKKAILDVEIIKTQWVKKWFDAKEHIENLNDNYILEDKFNSICDEYKVEMSSRDVLSKYLYNLGIAIHFDDFKMGDIHTLNPEWLINGIYSIITSKELSRNKGELDILTLSDILDEETYSKDTHQYIIALMQRFELCYAINDRYVLVLPSLPKESPKFEFDDRQFLRFEFEYSFLPPSLISTFMVKSHEHIEDKMIWREGVMLKDRITSSKAFIKFDIQDNRIFIYVKGEHKRDFFAIIRQCFYVINSKFEEIEITEWIPILPNSSIYRVKFQDLKNYEKANIDEYFNEELGESFSVSNLLNRVEYKEDRDKYIYNKRSLSSR